MNKILQISEKLDPVSRSKTEALLKEILYFYISWKDIAYSGTPQRPSWRLDSPSGKATAPSTADERQALLKGHISDTKVVASQETFYCIW